MNQYLGIALVAGSVLAGSPANADCQTNGKAVTDCAASNPMPCTTGVCRPTAVCTFGSAAKPPVQTCAIKSDAMCKLPLPASATTDTDKAGVSYVKVVGGLPFCF